MSTFTSRVTVLITAKFKAEKNRKRRTPTSEGLVGSLSDINLPKCRAAYSTDPHAWHRQSSHTHTPLHFRTVAVRRFTGLVVDVNAAKTVVSHENIKRVHVLRLVSAWVCAGRKGITTRTGCHIKHKNRLRHKGCIRGDTRNLTNVSVFPSLTSLLRANKVRPPQFGSSFISISTHAFFCLF